MSVNRSNASYDIGCGWVLRAKPEAPNPAHQLIQVLPIRQRRLVTQTEQVMADLGCDAAFFERETHAQLAHGKVRYTSAKRGVIARR